MKVAILYICTGKYNQFFKGFFESCEKYLLKDIAQLEYMYSRMICLCPTKPMYT